MENQLPSPQSHLVQKNFQRLPLIHTDRFAYTDKTIVSNRLVIGVHRC